MLKKVKFVCYLLFRKPNNKIIWKYIQLITAGFYRKLLHYVFQLCTFRFTRTSRLTSIEK